MKILSHIIFAYATDPKATAHLSKEMMAINTVFTLPIVNAFILMPVKIILLKLIPHSVEGLMTGLIQSIIVLNSEIVMRLVSILYLFGQAPFNTGHEYDYTGLPAAYMYSLIQMAVICPIAFYII